MSHPQQATSNGQKNNAGQNSGRETEEKNFWETVIAGPCYWVAKRIESPWPEESCKTFALWILSIIIDPLVLYTPRINYGKRLLDFDRSFLLILSVLYFLLHIWMLVIYCRLNSKSEKRYPKFMWIFIVGAPLVPVITNGPLQLLLIFNSTKEIRASPFSLGMALFLILYLVRVLGIYRLFAGTALRKSAVLRILINLILYLYGGHLFGGLWYFFAVWKKMQCWNSACMNHSGCRYTDHRFIVTSGDNRFLDDFCFNTKEDTTYELGIFKDALESHIVETKNLGKKLLYCLRWGTQNLSGYGQNLTVSTLAWENIFVILIAVYGMTTFAFFIGNVQNLTRSDQKARWTQEDLEKWSPFGKLSREQRKIILESCQESNWPQTGVVNVKNLLGNLPKKYEDKIRRTICLELLRKTEKFRGWSEASLLRICDCMKPMVYAERTHIVNKGDPIVEMCFVVQGNLWTYSANNIPQANKKDLLTYGDFYGEELVSWAQNELSSSTMPRSNRSIQAITEVEAFALMAVDLQNTFMQPNQ